MKKFSVAVAAVGLVLGLSGVALAGEYTCSVNCVGPSGSTTVTVRASSASEAASIVDKQSDKVCQSAGHRASTPQTMSASQCR